jgi:D-beta-D-heptose 7-phosphate kinase/D-beta-D-heptose 1-phosphate adenosyltransferase
MMDLREEWKAVVAEIAYRRTSNYKIIFTNGCFDIFHAGHVALLQYCARCEMEGLVVVGVNSDDSVRRLKGESRPINTLYHRRIVLKACRFVWETVGFDEDTPECLIREIKPDIIVKGSEYADKYIAGADFIRTYSGQVRLVPMRPDISTTLITERMKHGS